MGSSLDTINSFIFFLFDLDKVTGSGERAARDFLAETFFSDFDKHRKSQQSEAGS